MINYIYFESDSWRTFSCERLPVKPSRLHYAFQFSWDDAIDKYNRKLSALKAKSVKVGNPEILEDESLGELHILETSLPILEWPGSVEIKEQVGWDPINEYTFPEQVAILKLPETKEKDMKTEWISVKDQLPNLYDKVLAVATFSKEPLITNRFDIGHGKWKWDFSRYVGLYDCTITHWMPIPEMPKPQ